MSYKISPNPFMLVSDNTATVAVASTTAGQALTFDTVEVSKGVTLVSNSRITCPSTGDYLVTFSAQGTKGTGGTGYIDIWVAKNGTNVLRSNTRFTVTNGTYQICSAAFIFEATTAGDYFELIMCGDTTASQLASVALSAANPVRPASPNIIVTINKISK